MAAGDNVETSGDREMAVELKRRLFTIEEFQRMGETGILDEDERVELIEGEIVEMTPIGPPHASVVARLVALFAARLGVRAIVWPQNPFVLRPQTSQFQPDLALLRPRADFDSSRHPEPTDALLVVEVMDSSMARDRRVKLPIYARAGIDEVWLVHAVASTVEVCRDPRGSDYRNRGVLERSATVAPLAFPDLALTVADIVG
jgi:Uma2 family endonuclease